MPALLTNTPISCGHAVWPMRMPQHCICGSSRAPEPVWRRSTARARARRPAEEAHARQSRCDAACPSAGCTSPALQHAPSAQKLSPAPERMGRARKLRLSRCVKAPQRRGTPEPGPTARDKRPAAASECAPASGLNGGRLGARAQRTRALHLARLALLGLLRVAGYVRVQGLEQTRCNLCLLALLIACR